MKSLPEFLAGLVLVLIVLADVFGTVVVPRPSQNRLRIATLIGRAIGPAWGLANSIRSPELRQHAKAALGPFLLVAALAVWIAVMAVGFALMLHAQPGNVAMDDFGIEEALYQSTLALSTLGMLNADINGSARAVVALAGVCGFSTISLTVAFVLSVQNALHRREALVLTLPARAGKGLSPATILERSEPNSLAALFGQWEAWSAEVWQTHLSYPILCRFRSLHDTREWLHCWSAILDAAAFVSASRLPQFEPAKQPARLLIDTASEAIASLYELMGCRDATGVAQDEFGLMVVAVAGGNAGLPKGLEATRASYDATRELYAGRLRGLACKLDMAWN